MPWADTDLDKICEALGWPITFPYYREQLQRSMDDITALPTAEATITRVQGYLTDYATIRTARQTATTNQAGLIRQKTDGLEDEWGSTSDTAKGFNLELNNLREDLSRAMGVYHVWVSNGSGTGVRFGRGINSGNPYPSFVRYVR